MARLTAQQELFAQAVFRGLGLGEAYKQAGYRASNRNSQDAIASRLLRNAKIVERMEEMAQAKALTETITVQTVTNMLAAVYEDGRKYKQIGAAATAAMGIAKLHGLLVDRIEDITRKPARHPDAPLEIEVEHWLTEHKLLGQASEGAKGSDKEPVPPATESPYQSPEIVSDAESSTGLASPAVRAPDVMTNDSPNAEPNDQSPLASPDEKVMTHSNRQGSK